MASNGFVPQSTTAQNQTSGVITDITNLCLAINGNLRFGNGIAGTNGENIAGQWLTFTSGSTGAVNVLTHTLGSVPVGFITTNINKPAIIYSSGSSWTGSTVYLVSSTTSVTATVFLLG